MAVLFSADQSVIKKKFAIEDAPVTIGRHPECEVVIDDNSVSRRHATITQDQGQYYIEDLKSRNLTYVNSKVVPPPEFNAWPANIWRVSVVP